MTQKEIKAQFKLEEEKWDKLNHIDNDPRIQKLRDELNDLMDKVQKERKKALDASMARRRKLEDQLEASKKQLPEPSVKLQQWLSNYCSGVNFGARPKITWVSENEQFVIVSIAGSMGWSGIGQPYTYSQSHHMFIDTKKYPKYAWSGERCLEECDGRLTKEIKQRWIALVTKGKAK